MHTFKKAIYLQRFIKINSLKGTQNALKIPRGMPQKIWRPSTNQYYGTWVLFNQIKREWAGCQIGSERTESGCFLIAVSRFSSLGWLHLLRIHELLSHPGRVIMRLALGHQTHLFTGRAMSAYWYTHINQCRWRYAWMGAYAYFTTLLYNCIRLWSHVV